MNQNEGSSSPAKGNRPDAGSGLSGGPIAGWSGGSDVCPRCGRSSTGGGELEQFLGRLGITPGIIEAIEAQFGDVDIDECLNTAREHLKDAGGKAQMYAKQNPWKITAGIAALAFGVGLLLSRRHRTQDIEDRSRQLELKQALRGRKYPLEEVLRELDVAV